jgi:hypothetical protein
MIPRTRSLPADPNEPSFLTTFPPEIRNRIYEELLTQDGPIEVPDRHDLGKLGSCITLLRSCRQIYNEASSTFYGRNDFVVAPGCTYLDRDGRFEHNSFGIWFTSMGSQICLLTRVIISDKVSRLGYAPEVHQVELLPALRAMWATPTTALHITFGGKARCGTTYEYGTSSDLDAYFGNDNSFLNQALQSIRRNDILDLRKYRRFNGLLSSVTIWAQFRFYTATAVFSSTLPDRSIAKTFRISNDGQAIPTPLDKQQPKSFDLPRHIIQSILLYATQVSGRITIGSVADIKMATRLGAIWINCEL